MFALRLFTVAVALLPWSGLLYAADDEEPRYQIQATVYEQSAGADGNDEKAKVISRPRVTTFAGTQCRFEVGGGFWLHDGEWISHGLSLEVMIEESETADILLRGTLEHSEPVGKAKDQLTLYIERTHFARKCKLGEKQTLSLARCKTVKRWVELTVDEIVVR